MTGRHPPILLLLFNRPDKTRKLLSILEQLRPETVFVAVDGPRADVPAEVDACAQVVRLVTREMPWKGQFHYLIRQENLGCGRAVSSAITWFFEHVDEGIILEDDCLPHPSFFPFCRETLERWRDDEKVLTISGNNFHFGRPISSDSYFFSRYPHIWGWATWRRAWSNYDFAMSDWPETRRAGTLRKLLKWDETLYWTRVFDDVHAGRIDTWDYQLTYLSFMGRQLNIIPGVNLVANNGFDSDATHTDSQTTPFANMQTFPVVFPLRHPTELSADETADRRMQIQNFQGRSYLQRLIRERLARLFRKMSGLKQ